MMLLADPSQAYMNAASAFERTSRLILGMPFDMAREHYAKAVQVGLIEHSMLSSAKFEQSLVALEKLSLGPLARSV
jgi:hypothetical protein